MRKDVLEKKLQKALELAPPNVFDKVANCYFQPTVCGDHQLFYAHEAITRTGKTITYTLVDMSSGQASPLFNHKALAAALSEAVQSQVSPTNLKLNALVKTDSGITFQYDNHSWSFNSKTLTRGEVLPHQALVISPNGKYGAFTKNHNLYIKVLDSGEIFPLTTDGRQHFGYAGIYEGNAAVVKEQLEGYVRPAGVVWSPDSRKLFTYRVDERGVKPLHLLQNVTTDGDIRPKLFTYKYAFPQDREVPICELFLCNVEERTIAPVLQNIPVCIGMPFSGDYSIVEWSTTGDSAVTYRISDDFKNAEVFVVDTNTGGTTLLFNEVSDTFLFFDFYRAKFGTDPRYSKTASKQMWYSTEYNSLLWISQRDGFFHLYDYDVANKTLRRQLSSGQFNLRQVIAVDRKAEAIYVTAAGVEEGSSPYKMKLYKLCQKSGDLTLLTPDEFEHFITISNDGLYFADNFSRPDTAPMVILREIGGKYISTILEADTAPLEKMGISYPMPFIEKGHNGDYDVHGLIVFPYDFDPTKKYPIVDYYYGGNQTTNVPTNFYDYLNKGLLNPLSELGFVAVIIDGRGTPFRSEEYHRPAHRNLAGCCGMEDHVAVLKALCQKYPFMDHERIGVWGHSGGGFATYKCMVHYPEVYKCGMASSGNHMQDLYSANWSMRFMNKYDPDLWAAQSSEHLAHKLEGQLLLIHGELDDNVHPSATMRLVQALIEADRDFEFLLMPNCHHLLSPNKYYQKKVLNFFAKNMLN